MKKQILMSACCLTLLGGCGFTPMYGTAFQESETALDISEHLAQVDIGNIPDREGQFLRNALIDRFYRDGRPVNARYSLSVGKINERISDLDITKTSDTTRSKLHVKTSIKLTDNQTGETILKRTLNATSSFNELSSEFATRISERNTRENALNELAQQIELQIGLYLQRNQ